MRRTVWASKLVLLALLATAGCDDGGSDAVSGTITLSPERQARLGASDTLFITARPAGTTGGPPLAVLKIVGMQFPLKYTLGQEDVILPGTFFKGAVDVQAVLRKSGMATLPVPGDVRGRYGKPVTPGTTGVDLALDQPDEGAQDGAASGAQAAQAASGATAAGR